MTRDTSLDVAVTGVAARLPGPAGLDAWWASMMAGVVHLRTLTREQLLSAGSAARFVDDPSYVPVHGILGRADSFDSAFFGISPRQAQRMDPQHRLALEVAWNALEDAGVPPRQADQHGRRTGVFASCTGSGYQRWVLARNDEDPTLLDDLIHGTESDFLASRVAYKLGLTGPALAVQTACSSSLVAVHLAVQSLTNGDCDRALVVATGMQYPQAGYLHLAGGVQSPTGRCRPFDVSADGVVGGSGAAAIVLELADMLNRDDATPHGVILGTAINNDGSGKVGYFAPSGEGQERVIRDALHAAGVSGSSIGYLETHGTGTYIGDPVEWQAADAAYRAEGAAPGQIVVGALKANIGHLDSCAGLAGLIKTLMVLETGAVPPVAGFTAPNPLLAGGGSALVVPAQARTWDGPEPRRAGVSAFGIGGTNAHVIVAAHSVPVTTGGSARSTAGAAVECAALVAVSAGDAPALDRVATGVADHMEARAGHGHTLAQVARTLAVARSPLPWRRAVVGDTPDEIARLLRRSAPGATPAPVPAPLAFAFPGQGTQTPGMAQPYLQALPGFGAVLDDTLAAVPDNALRARLRAALLDANFPAVELDQTALAQPAIVGLQIAVATVLRHLGLRPAVVLGHSLGELSAAVAAGVVDGASALAFAVERGRAMQQCLAGGMLAIGCSEAQARLLIAGTDLQLAAVNAPESCVVAGPDGDVRALEQRLGTQFYTRRLRATRAFHSQMLDEALPLIAAAVTALTPRPAMCVFATAADGHLTAPGTAPDLTGWVRAAIEPVRFGQTVAAVVARVPGAVALEIGPGRPLSPILEMSLPTITLGSRASALSGRDVLSGLATLWTAGQPLDLDRLLPPTPIVRLPGYPFAGPTHQPETGRAASPAPATPAPASASAVQVAGPSGPDPSPAPAEAVARAWRDLLGRDDLTGTSDFFDVGGDSLLVTRLVRALNEDFGVRVPVRELLRARTLAGHVAVVEDAIRPES